MSHADTWTGCFEVLLTEEAKQLDQRDSYGAFVNVVAYAASESHFREIAAEALIESGYKILDTEGVSAIDLPNSGLPEDELSLITESLSDSPVAFGYFHSYPKDGLDA